jgi:hypothetical protein
MGKNKDLVLLQGLSGSEDPTSIGMCIDDTYFEREEMENRREQGYPVPEEWIPSEYTDREKDIWKHERWLAELNQRLTNKPQSEYCGEESEDPMEKVIDQKEGNLDFLGYYDQGTQETFEPIIMLGPDVRMTHKRVITFRKAPETGVLKSSIEVLIERIVPAHKDKKGKIVPEQVVKRIKVVHGCKDALIWSGWDKKSINIPTGESRVVNI